MRAICESCAKPQPLDWRGGDQCVWCGEAVRREVRCFWCVNWTPAVKFCRTCGAATVDSALFGAARMLKDAGCDRFTVPRQLKELEPDQIENFTRIYQEHAAVVDQHVEQLVFLEQYLEQKHWNAELEESLTPQLPWPLEKLASMRAAAKKVHMEAEGLNKAKAIGEATPFYPTKALSLIVRLALGDWKGALDPVMGIVRSADEPLKVEGALAVSNWRVLYDCGLAAWCVGAVVDALRVCPNREKAAVRMAMLGEPTGELLPPGDFGTALVNGDIDSLCAAAREPVDDMRRYAAARKLIDLGVLGPVAQVLLSVPEDYQQGLVEYLERWKKPFPELRGALFDLARDTRNGRVHRAACCVLCYGCPPEDAIRIARMARNEEYIYQALLQKTALPPGALEEFGEFLLRAGLFRMNWNGMNDIAKEGRMPADFVTRQWRDASSEARVELCKFAEAQLLAYGDEALHRFLVDVAFTPGVVAEEVKVYEQAWSGLHRWYDSFGYPRRRPIRVSGESIDKLFGSAAQFLTRFAAILRERPPRAVINEVLGYPDSSALSAIAGAPRQAVELAQSLAEVMRDPEVDFGIRLACADFLGFLGSEPTLRRGMSRLLTSFAGTDLNLQSTRALERMTNGPAWVTPQ
jgi:hypothetical protein